MERGNLDHDVKGNGPRGRTPRLKVPKRDAGTDQLVVAKKPGNAGGAKGLKDSVEGMGQPVKGGIYA